MTELRAQQKERDFDEAGLALALQQRLAELLELGAHPVEPALCDLLQGMMRRYAKRPSRYLLQRMQHSLTALESRLEAAGRQAKPLAESMAHQHQEYAESLAALMEANRWREVLHLVIKAQSETASPGHQLSALREQVIKGELINPAQAGALSFDDFLMSQEQEILASIQDDSCESATSSEQKFANDQPSELRSIKHFRESWVKLNSERLLAQAIAEMPKDAGPLNSHRLAIRSLTAMRDLSPEYLNRFLSYLETLLWLEKAGDSIGLAPRSRAKKPGSPR